MGDVQAFKSDAVEHTDTKIYVVDMDMEESQDLIIASLSWGLTQKLGE